MNKDFLTLGALNFYHIYSFQNEVPDYPHLTFIRIEALCRQN